MSLGQVFSAGRVILSLQSAEKDELFEELLEALVSSQPGINRAEALAALQAREEKMSTGIMHGIAIPHGNCMSAEGVIGAIGISRRGIDYESLDKSPVHLVFMLLCNPAAVEAHLAVLKELAAVLQHPAFVREMLDAESPERAYGLLCEYEGDAE